MNDSIASAPQEPDRDDPPSFDEESREIAEQTMTSADNELARLNRRGCGSAVLLIGLLSAACTTGAIITLA